MKSKLYPCKQCGTEVKIRSKGLCPFCRNLQKGTLVKRYIAKRQSTKIKEQRKTRYARLEKFFNYHLANISKRPFCENCGCRLQGNIANIAHILPKRNTANPEVMDELDNCLYLCAAVNGETGCHDKFDRIQGSSKVYLMKCWKTAYERFKLLQPLLVKYNKYVLVFEEWEKEIKNGE